MDSPWRRGWRRCGWPRARRSSSTGASASPGSTRRICTSSGRPVTICCSGRCTGCGPALPSAPRCSDRPVRGRKAGGRKAGRRRAGGQKAGGQKESATHAWQERRSGSDGQGEGDPEDVLHQDVRPCGPACDPRTRPRRAPAERRPEDDQHPDAPGRRPDLDGSEERAAAAYSAGVHAGGGARKLAADRQQLRQNGPPGLDREPAPSP